MNEYPKVHQCIHLTNKDDTPKVVTKREEDKLICKGHILNALSDWLYDLYTNTHSVREIQEALEKKYKVRKEGTKKFLICQYIDFKASLTTNS